jgi:hypothetical protein
MTFSLSELQVFAPGEFILIDDVLTGTRKLAQVTESGNSYLDLDAEDATPFPIYKTLDPKGVGNVLGWALYLADREPQHAQAFMDLFQRLFNSGTGVLTYTRAAYWAFANRRFLFDEALQAGKTQTEAVAAGRLAMDRILQGVGEVS